VDIQWPGLKIRERVSIYTIEKRRRQTPFQIFIRDGSFILGKIPFLMMQFLGFPCSLQVALMSASFWRMA
jgi:hypothetical protein